MCAVYDLKLVVYYANYSSNKFEKVFNVEVKDYCIPSSVTPVVFSDNPKEYIIG